MKPHSRLIGFWLLGHASALCAQQATSVGVDQLSPAERSVASPLPAARDNGSPTQVSSPAEGRRFERPVTSSGPRAAPPPQLAPAGRSAAGAPALSRPAEGRDTRTERIAGNDRCDPRAPGAARPLCQRVIETRAGEYTRPDAAALSPEQRLLAERQIGADAPRGLSSAAQRLANNVADPTSPDAQAVAAVTLVPAPTATDKRPASPTDDAANAAALVNAILGSGTVVVSPQGK